MLKIQGLKKQLRGIRSTKKLTKAMRTVSTVKFSKLNEIYNEYSKYGKRCRDVFEQYGSFFENTFRAADPQAPSLVLVMASNKGLCGKFNAEILHFADEKLEEMDSALVAACGKMAIQYFQGKGRKLEKKYELQDIPFYGESNSIMEDILTWRQEGKISQVYIIYPQYVNMMIQMPKMCKLFSEKACEEEESNILFLPDKATVNKNVAKLVFHALFHEFILETALGAQAATLMTMRSAYDTATEYYEEIEGEINRMRQSAVTADVIETSAERKEEGIWQKDQKGWSFESQVLL